MEPNTGLAPVSLRYELSVSLSILVGRNIAGSPSIVKRKVFQDFPVASRFPHLIEVPERCRFGTCHIISIHSIFGTTGRNRTHVNPVKSREHRHSATVVYFWSGRWDLNPQSLRSERSRVARFSYVLLESFTHLLPNIIHCIVLQNQQGSCPFWGLQEIPSSPDPNK